MPAVPGQMPQAAPAGAAPPGAAPQTGGPSASPMMTPQQPKGQQASGKAKVMIAIHILKTSMVHLGLGEDFQAVLDAVKTLTKKFGKTEEDSKQIMPAEIMQAMMKQ